MTGSRARGGAALVALAAVLFTSGCGGEDVDGALVFAEADCGTCHTFAAAQAEGDIGPDLDLTTLSAEELEAQVREGTGSMPAFKGSLTDAEIDAVVEFVDENRRGLPPP